MSRSRFSAGWCRFAPLLVLAACGGGGGGAAGQGPSGPAPVHTLAYAVSDCREGAQGGSGHEALWIRQGEHDPVTVVDFPPVSPLLPPGLCRDYAVNRGGRGPSLVGDVQRLAVSPDGSFIVFETTNALSIIPADPLPPEKEGMFFVHADGSGLRKLGPASREPAFRFMLDFSSPAAIVANFDSNLAISPSGGLIAFLDRGPGPAGEDATQIFTLDIATGTRTQVTHLPPANAPDPLTFATRSPWFGDDGTIGFASFSNPEELNPEGTSQFFFFVNVDGTGLTKFVEQQPVVLDGSRVITTFQITPQPEYVETFQLTGPPVHDEVFVFLGADLSQLTNFGRPDTSGWFLSADHQRAFFTASANPRDTNPFENCQLFSIDALGSDLRQLTTFGTGQRSVRGCGSVAFGPGSVLYPPDCGLYPLGEDADTQTLVFSSQCDPLGKNPNGTQVFAMRPDGTGLRPLTETRGVVTEADGTITVESPSVLAYGPSL